MEKQYFIHLKEIIDDLSHYSYCLGNKPEDVHDYIDYIHKASIIALKGINKNGESYFKTADKYIWGIIKESSKALIYNERFWKKREFRDLVNFHQSSQNILTRIKNLSNYKISKKKTEEIKKDQTN